MNEVFNAEPPSTRATELARMADILVIKIDDAPSIDLIRRTRLRTSGRKCQRPVRDTIGMKTTGSACFTALSNLMFATMHLKLKSAKTHRGHLRR